MIPNFKAHPWHGISAGQDAPNVVNVFVEIVPSDTIKYEVDKQSGYLKVDRPQQFSNIIPALYGFIPRTYCEDDDPLDVLVLASEPLAPMSMVRCYPIGVVRMLDNNEIDDKIIAKANEPAHPE